MFKFGVILFAVALAAAAVLLCGTQPMQSGDLNRLKQRAEYQFK